MEKTKFAEARPADVLLGKFSRQEYCSCPVCQNIHQLFLAQPWLKEQESCPKTFCDFMSQHVCDTENSDTVCLVSARIATYIVSHQCTLPVEKCSSSENRSNSVSSLTSCRNPSSHTQFTISSRKSRRKHLLT